MGSSRDCTQRGWAARGTCDCCTCPFGGRVDVYVLVSLMPEVTGKYRGCAGAGIWLLVARVGAELCRAVYIPQPER